MVEFPLECATEATVQAIADERQEPAWLREDRLRWLARFAKEPVESSQLFIHNLDFKGVDVASVRPLYADGAAPSDKGPDDVAGFVAFRNGRWETVYLRDDLAKAGVFFGEARELLAAKPKVAKGLLVGPEALRPSEKFGAMVRALSTAALVLHVPNGLEVAEPFTARWHFDAPGRAVFARTLVSLGKGAVASFIEEADSPRQEKGEQSLFGATSEVLLNDGAQLQYAAVENLGDHVVSFFTRQAEARRDGGLHWALGGFGGVLMKSRVNTTLAGRGANIRQIEVVFGRGRETYDMTTHVWHKAPETTSDLSAKGAMQQKSKSYMKGVITIEKGGAESDSYLSQHAMLLSKESRSTAIPSLEIETNQVRRAKHAASVTQIDEDQVFYLETRGLDREAARKLVVQGFLDTLIDRIALTPAKDRVRDLFEARWVG
jgi:Fe-S cluster assembly protein SufD